MSQFLSVAGTEVDQDSRLTGRYATAPNRDSVAEKLRERDAYLYEQVFADQAPSDPSFFGAVTTDRIAWEAFGLYTVPADPDIPNDGIRCSQLDHSSNLGPNQTDGGVALTRTSLVVVKSGVALADGVWFATFSTYFEVPAGVDTEAEWRMELVGGAWQLQMIITSQGVTVGTDWAHDAKFVFWRVA